MFLFQVNVKKKQYVANAEIPKTAKSRTPRDNNETFMEPVKKSEPEKKKPKHETPKGRVDWVTAGAVK